jgi:mono/diheme cytochrome c family protein
MKPFLLFAAGALIVVGLVALVLWQGGPMQERADPENADQVARGQVVYAQHCASCHGERLQGQPNWRERKSDGRLPAPPHDDTGHTWHHSDEQLFQITKIGVKPPLAPEGYESDMPSFAETLSNEDIWAVLSFIKSIWSDKSRFYQERIDEAYRKQAEQK